MTLSSRSDPVWLNATVASLPTTRATTIVSDSMMTGFTLPGMIDDPGWVAGRASSARPARGPIPRSRMSDAIFQVLRAAARMAPWAAIGTSRVAWAWKWLGASRTGSVSQLGQAGARPGREGRMGIDPGPDRGPAERHGQELVAGRLDPPDRLLDLAGIAAELLAEPDRRGVLEVRPTGLDDGPELVRLGGQRGLQLDERRDERFLDGHRRGQLEGRRDACRWSSGSG